MVILTGNNLGKRHHELNIQLNEAFSNNVKFKSIKDATEKSDADTLFKIEFAAKKKEIGYIIETLKSGDSLFISKALKRSSWLYDDELSYIINTDYLHENIFPYMSLKMQNKFLTQLSTRLTNKDRASEFFTYCCRMQLLNLTNKFLIKTSNSFKQDYIQDEKLSYNPKFLNLFIGDSFDLLDAYLEKQTTEHRNILLRQFSRMYFVSDEKYLQMLEKYMKTDVNTHCEKKLGLRISKDIMIKHKHRVLNNTRLYICLLNNRKICRHSKIGDAKAYLANFMPDSSHAFWEGFYLQKTEHIFNVIPAKERFEFMKKLFLHSYPFAEFDLTEQFHSQEYYKLMTLKQQEDWASAHLRSGKQVLGKGYDYLWYRFTSFEDAFKYIKKCVQGTNNNLTLRNEIIKTLIQSAKNQRDLKRLFDYYYEKHVNEPVKLKENFLKEVLLHHNAYQFEDDCWESYHKLLCSLVGHNNEIYRCPEFKVTSLCYYIFKEKSFPDVLNRCLEENISSYTLSAHIEKFDSEKKKMVYERIINFYLEKLSTYLPIQGDPKHLENIKKSVSTNIKFILDFIAMIGKSKNEVPEIIMCFVNLDWDTYKYHDLFESKNNRNILQNFLLGCLKSDVQTLVDNIDFVKNEIVKSRQSVILNMLLKKLRVYFYNDIAKDFVKLFKEILFEKRLFKSSADTAVFGIIMLDSEPSKLTFIQKYKPTSSIIPYNIPCTSPVLKIQESICRFACYSRPPIPLPTMLAYIKGDYVKYCLPMFDMYFTNLPQYACVQFVQAIIESPFPIQNHGLRLAFLCFDVDDLKNTILTSWGSTQNATKRSVIYRCLFVKTVTEGSRVLFDILKTITANLCADDKEELFCCLTFTHLSEKFLGEFMEVAWATLDRLPENPLILRHKTKLIGSIDEYLELMKKETVTQMIESFTTDILRDNLLYNHSLNVSDFLSAQWSLIAHYIVYYTNNSDLEKSVNVLKSIVNYCLQNYYIYEMDYKVILQNFIDKLNEKCYTCDNVDITRSSPIFEIILEKILKSLPLPEIYMTIWKLRLIVTNRKAIIHSNQIHEKTNDLKVIYSSVTYFGKEIAKIVEEFKNDNIYYRSFSEHIAELIDTYSKYILLYIGDPKLKVSNIELDKILVSVAQGILDFDAPEAHLLALHLLPANTQNNDNSSVTDRIKLTANLEILCYLQSDMYKTRNERQHSF